MQKQRYTTPSVSLLLTADEDILVTSDEFELATDWFASAADAAGTSGGSDAPVA